MATLTISNVFAPNTLIESSEANQNFQDVVTFVNGSVMHRDASSAFTAVPSGPATDPSSDNQFARKAYVDKLGIVAQQTLTVNGAGPWAVTTTTDMALNNVSVIAGRTYGIHLLTQWELSNVGGGAWSLVMLLNGATYRRMWINKPEQTGTMEGTADATVYWTPSVTQATDDIAIQAVENINGATFNLTAGATFPRTLTLIDMGVI